MAPLIPPLDEQTYNNPGLIAAEMPGFSLNADSIHWYFMNSPFFDRGSNNNAFLMQLQYSPEQPYFYASRANFEKGLRERYPDGIQFMVVGEPQEPNQPWVVQKQLVREREVVQVLGTYYTMGTAFFMAPSLLDVLHSRLVSSPSCSLLASPSLSISNNVAQFSNLAQNLTHFSPATGHTYLPPSYTLKASATGGDRSSRAGSLAPSVTDLDASTAPTSLLTGTEATAAQSSITNFSNPLFIASLNLTGKFGHEYMDENPLQGEPGSFVYSSTKEQVEARNKAAVAAAAASSALSTSALSASFKAESVVSSVAPTPKPLPAELGAGPGAASRKGSLANVGVGKVPGKERRRKSKGLASPISPTGSVGKSFP
ncbi:hypothetical protein P154DRAFT_561994 [Amniculicola lignicola CBS 123094]|uniref:Mediator of RNA polymerase II transcription subunit 6 n=1 Tax=Amniculicola lignicola CBS 123094 TaxID=1392246 RepID=A0A6A5WNQ8_9PLEO|nr:hypothetical protein P154DRAFT_561994 [Amniculicola lignicola CBS 123094]